MDICLKINMGGGISFDEEKLCVIGTVCVVDVNAHQHLEKRHGREVWQVRDPESWCHRMHLFERRGDYIPGQRG